MNGLENAIENEFSSPALTFVTCLLPRHIEIARKMAESFKGRVHPSIACDVTDLYSIANFALFQAAEQYCPARGNFESFARLVVWRSMRQHVRSLRENRDLPLTAGRSEQMPILPDELATRSQLGNRLGLAISKLPQRLRVIVSMVYGEGISQRESANKLGITEGRISQLHGEAIRRIRCEVQQRGKLQAHQVGRLLTSPADLPSVTRRHTIDVIEQEALCC